MLHKLHSLPGLIFAVMLSITAATGAILSFDSFAHDLSAPQQAADTITLADLAERITARYPDVEKIARTPSGRVRVTYAQDGAPKAMMVYPQTAAPLGELSTSPVMRTITNLHRAWLAGDGGRAAAGVFALAMLVLAITGLLLLRRHLGGWLKLVAPLHGSGMRRWHQEIGRLAAAGLLFSSITGCYLSLTGFEIVPDGKLQDEALVSASGGERLPLGQVQGLQSLTLQHLREMTLPYAGDATDPITIRTDSFVRHVDAASGDTLREEPHGLAWHLHDVMYRLHTARGMMWLALMLGLSSMAGVALALTGLAVWLRKHFARAELAGNVSAADAQILLLVGSEGGTTWSFAKTLHGALTIAGCKVHTAAMNDLPAVAPNARHLIVLAATTGDGEAPASAIRFLDRLAKWSPPKGVQALVLGFGDSQFARFCGYAHTVEAALRARGIPLAMASAEIDRQSHAAFMDWGRSLSACLAVPLQLDSAPAKRPTSRFILLEREDYGHEVQAPTAILRFGIAGNPRWLPRDISQWLGLSPRFSAGDLVGICPPGDPLPRYYSLASSSNSGVLEICVRKQPGGLCSGYLHGLVPGSSMEASIRLNPGFRPDSTRRPLILIGAGAGIAPLVGFVREVGHRRPVHLYWGGRSAGSDFLYQHELELHELDGRLAGLRTIFSRQPGGGYVQNLLHQDSEYLRGLMAAGAQILICGAREMAAGATQALAAALAPLGLTLTSLREQGRLIEDVY